MSDWGPCAECGAVVTVCCADRRLGESGPITLSCDNGHSIDLPAETSARTRIGAMRRIDRSGMAERVEGYLVDIQTARLLCAVYDALSPANRERFGKPPLERLVALGWKVAR